MEAEIISIGDELLIGQVINTNASWMARRLAENGIRARNMVVVPDEAEDIRKAVDVAFGRSEVILVTGGLGPTKDDITKKVLCDYFGTRLVFHQPSFDNILRLFPTRASNLSPANRQQADIPENCTPVMNQFGTAPGMIFRKEGRILVSMPGVPFEMEAMMNNDVIPMLKKSANSDVMVCKTLLTQGVGESYLSELIAVWEESLPENMKLAYLPQPGIVRLRLNAYGDNRETLQEQIDFQSAKLEEIIPDLIFGYGDDTMEAVAGKLLREKGKSLSTAESCTGGYLAHLITSVPGSSDYFKGSVVAYANDIKMALLGVSEGSLARHGAVSEEVVREMALGALEKFNTDYAVSTSGVAGPDGGTPEKPVGTVWVAVASRIGATTKLFRLGDHRGRNIRRAALSALNMLRLELLKTKS
ncbi:MAG TPA: competence/damage-inducible protein A [Bacteroidales bacterium]|nr:competence/damage-inducible protein A [Bacteroidales bacterium]HOX77317.1 competence/damage-inducible protein A [Bacteroidales bacterium]HPI85931.1 competence/damage-inducible protein A [Bacteroidales bacterium]HPM93495.1 competence/damage-inducible protein A [Bacteroidales bacterium]